MNEDVANVIMSCKYWLDFNEYIREDMVDEASKEGCKSDVGDNNVE